MDKNTQLRINILFLIVTLVMSYYFSELRFGMNRIYENATPGQLVLGTAETPYQYRVLVPWMVNVITRLSGVSLTAVNGVFQIVEFLSIFALVVAFRAYLRLFFHHLLLASVLSFTLFYMLPFNLLYNFWYPYDIPSVLFFTLGLMALYRQAWGWYYLVFVLASLNRETALFLTMIFVLVSLGKMPWKTLAGHTAVQLMIWVVVKITIQAIYAHNVGAAFQFTLVENLQFLAQPGGWLWMLPNWGMAWVLVLIGYRWLTDPFIKRSVWVAVPFFLTMLLVGNIYELRIYSELIPIMLVPALMSVQALFKLESVTQAS